MLVMVAALEKATERDSERTFVKKRLLWCMCV